MAIVTRTVAPTPITSGARRLFTAQAMPDGLRGFNVEFTTANPNSWSQVAGQGRIVQWGVDIRIGGGPFQEWFTTNNVVFGELGPRGSMPSVIHDSATFAEMQAMQARVWVETEGVTVRLGVTIRASNISGEVG
jgi:hypothetical protein